MENARSYLKNKRDAARYLGISIPTVDRLMREGLPYIRFRSKTGAVYFRPEDLNSFIDLHRIEACASGGDRVK